MQQTALEYSTEVIKQLGVRQDVIVGIRHVSSLNSLPIILQDMIGPFSFTIIPYPDSENRLLHILAVKNESNIQTLKACGFSVFSPMGD